MSRKTEQSLPAGWIVRLVEAFDHLLKTGDLPPDLPPEIHENPAVIKLVQDLDAIQGFSLALANGDLEPELKLKGKVAGALKTLQANLRHLTWQTQRIASGDLSQRVAFMGDFAAAFNAMVENLSQSREILEQRAIELAQQRRAALDAMYEAQDAQREAQNANRLLHEQLREIYALQARLREQAIRDPLTGCFNRRYLEETLDREFSRALREHYPISLAMLDIDHFKNVNDRFGHQAGDLMLQALGDLLRAETRAGDIACRYGGEEFLLVLPNMPLEPAFQRAESWRLLFQELRVLAGDGAMDTTISCGLAAFPEHGRTHEAVLEAADHALYAAKYAGRNRVRVYRPSQ